MTISLRNGGNNTGATGVVSGATLTVPPGLIASDISILNVIMKQATAGTAPTVTTPSGWTQVGSTTGEATNLTAGTDTGSMFVAQFYRLGTYATGPTITTTGSNVTGAGVYALAGSLVAAGTHTWDLSQSTTGSDSTSGANGSITGAANINLAVDDWMWSTSGLSGDLGTISAETLTAAGATATRTGRVVLAITTNTDARMAVSDAVVTAGTSSAPPVYTWTNTSSLTGHARITRIREAALPAPIRPTVVARNQAVIRAAYR